MIKEYLKPIVENIIQEYLKQFVGDIRKMLLDLLGEKVIPLDPSKKYILILPEGDKDTQDAIADVAKRWAGYDITILFSNDAKLVTLIGKDE